MGLSVVSLLWANRQPPNKIILKLTLSHNFHLHVECRFWSTCLMDKWKSHQNWVRTVPTLFLTLAHTHTHAHFLSLSLSLSYTHTHTVTLSHTHSLALTLIPGATPAPHNRLSPHISNIAQHQTSSTLRIVDNSLIIILLFTLVNKSTNKYQFVWEQDIFLWEVNINHIEHFSNI